MPVAGPQIAALAPVAGKYRVFLIALGLGAVEAVVAHAHFAFRMPEAARVAGFAAVLTSLHGGHFSLFVALGKGLCGNLGDGVIRRRSARACR